MAAAKSPDWALNFLNKQFGDFRSRHISVIARNDHARHRHCEAVRPKQSIRGIATYEIASSPFGKLRAPRNDICASVCKPWPCTAGLARYLQRAKNNYGII